MKHKMLILVVSLFSASLLSSGAGAQKISGCPAFDSSMVDAAFLAIDYSPSPFTEPEVFVIDDPAVPEIWCTLTDPEDPRGEQFFVRVVDGEHPGDEGVAHLFGRSDHFGSTVLRTRLADLTEAEMKACAAEVRKSFVWNKYCQPSESPPDGGNQNHSAIVFTHDECHTVLDHYLMDFGISIGAAESDRVHIVGRYAGGSFPHSSAKATCKGTHSLDVETPQVISDVPCMIEGIPEVTEDSVMIITPGGHWSLSCTWPRS